MTNSTSLHLTDLSGRVALSNGVEMPYFGLGVYRIETDVDPMTWAIDAGYRLLDTATIYQNEAKVGEAVRSVDVPREELFITSKVWNSDQGYDSTRRAFEASLARLGLDYLDLYLIHWPVEETFVETWRALEALYEDGVVRAIGVSNFMQHHLETLTATSDVVPMVNQVEFHPYLVQQSLIDYCRDHAVQYQSWSPLMGGRLFNIETLVQLAEQHGRSVAQIVLRWNLQKGVAVIPKSVHKDRIISNADVFDFSLSDADVALIDSLDRGQRVGPDPDNFDL